MSHLVLYIHPKTIVEQGVRGTFSRESAEQHPKRLAGGEKIQKIQESMKQSRKLPIEKIPNSHSEPIGNLPVEYSETPLEQLRRLVGKELAKPEESAANAARMLPEEPKKVPN